MQSSGIYHTPALLKETIAFLRVKSEGKYIDATLGGGGHSEEILKAGGRLLAIDCDPDAIKNAKIRFSACPSPSRVVIVKGNFADLGKIARENGSAKVDGILFDLGVSGHQLDEPKRGFSFDSQSPLDMRMDPDLSVNAKDLVNGLSEKELTELFIKLGEEKFSRQYAHAIVEERKNKPIETGEELAQIVLKIRTKKFGQIPACYRLEAKRLAGRHPATKIFQALRIAVNDELNALRKALPQAVGLLNQNGRLAIISFHSLEDGIVKNFFEEKEKERLLKIITQKPVEPGEEEIKENSRVRSAKLRVIEKL